MKTKESENKQGKEEIRKEVQRRQERIAKKGTW